MTLKVFSVVVFCLRAGHPETNDVLLLPRAPESRLGRRRHTRVQSELTQPTYRVSGNSSQCRTTAPRVGECTQQMNWENARLQQ